MDAHSDHSSSSPSASDSQGSETSGRSQSDMARGPSPDSVDLNASQAPLLRIWGYFQDRSRPPTKLFEREEDTWRDAPASHHTQYHLRLTHHDSKDGQADLSNPRWFDDLPAFEKSDLELKRQKVAQNHPVRQDRLVAPDYWEPIEIRLHHEVEHEHWVLVQLVLYNWTRSTSTAVYSPPISLLSQHVSSYIRAYSRENQGIKAAAGSSFLRKERAETEAALPIRGRKRRALRHSAGIKVNDSADQRNSTPKPSDVSLQDTVPQLRGRLKRRLRRGRLHVRDHADPLVKETIRQDTLAKDTQEHNTSPNRRHGVIEDLEKHGLAVRVLESPVIAVVESFQPVYLEPDLMVEYYASDEAIIIPIKDPISESILGSLHIAKAAFTKRREKAPWDSSIVDRTTIAVTKLDTSVDSDLDGSPISRKDYWQKFPVRYVRGSAKECSLLLPLTPYFIIQSLTNTHIVPPSCTKMSLADATASLTWLSRSSGHINARPCFLLTGAGVCTQRYESMIVLAYRSRQLVLTESFPDQEEEYSQEFFLVSPHDFLSRIRPSVGSKTAETLRWLSDRSETWHDQRVQWKNLDMPNLTAAFDDDTTDAESLSPVPPQLEESHSTLRKVDYYFTRALGLLEFQDSRNGDRLNKYTETEQYSRSSSPQRRSSTGSAPAVEQEVAGRTRSPPETPDDLEAVLPAERSASPSEESSYLSEESSYMVGSDPGDTDDNDDADSESIDEYEKDLKSAHVCK